MPRHSARGAGGRGGGDLALRALDHHQSHITRTAADPGLARSHLFTKLKAPDTRRDATGKQENGEPPRGSRATAPLRTLLELVESA
jgi:hypothetical protein